MTSLRQRLSRGLISVLSILFVLHWLAADWVIRAVAEKQMATRLNEDGFTLLESLSSDDNGTVIVNSLRISSVYNRPYSGHYFVVQVDGKPSASISLQNYALSLQAIGPNQARLYHIQRGPQQQPLLVLGQGYVKFGHKIVISVAQSLSGVDHDITYIRLAYFSLTLVILGCAIGLQRYDVNRALRPLVNVGRELEYITSGHQQQITADVPIEIKPLVNEINRLMLLVVRRLQQSRTAIGNLAHALKSPLAILFRIVEHPALSAHPELQQQLQAQIDTVHRSIERELKRARIAGNRQASAALNPKLEVTTLSKLLLTIYADKGLAIQVVAPDELLHFDREDFLEILGNVLDNACKWAKHTIIVDIKCADRLIIQVEDDGPGADLLVGQLAQRGLRLDESTQGHGLGLAIVEEIAGFYEGVLHFGRSENLGGFLVTINLSLN